MRLVGLVTARGGSKGIPGKNLIDLGGRPLIVWTIDAALAYGRIDRLLVSTDAPEIAAVARAAGAEVPFLRPSSLATDDATSVDVALHALDYLGRSAAPDWLLLLQPTSPLRDATDIAAAVELSTLHRDAEAVVSVTETTPPTWNVMLDSIGRFAPSPPYGRRQDEPPTYRTNGAIYLVRPEVLRDQRTFRPKRTYAYIMPASRSVDIDTVWDLELARLIAARPVDAPVDH